MQGQEQIGSSLSHHADALLPGRIDVAIARHQNLVATGGLQLAAQFTGGRKRDRALMRAADTDRTGIMSAMTGIDHDNAAFTGRRGVDSLDALGDEAVHVTDAVIAGIVPEGFLAGPLKVDNETIIIAARGRIERKLLGDHGRMFQLENNARRRSGIVEEAEIVDQAAADALAHLQTINAPGRGRKINHQAGRDTVEGESTKLGRFGRFHNDPGTAFVPTKANGTDFLIGQSRGSGQDRGDRQKCCSQNTQPLTLAYAAILSTAFDAH